MNIQYERFDKRRFGKRLKQLRKKHNLTQAILAEWLNTSSYTLSNYERGARIPTVEFVHNLSKLTGITVQDLMDMEKEL